MSFYDPLVIRLEVKPTAERVDFSNFSANEAKTDEEKQAERAANCDKRRLYSGMKKKSPGLDGDEDAPRAPSTSVSDRGKMPRVAPQPSFHGRRTYSEVVVETLPREGDERASLMSDDLPQSSRAASVKAASEPLSDIERIDFFSGNPFVEKTEGILHFYKYNDDELARAARCRMLCMLAVPAQLSVSDIVSFIGPSLSHIEEMKIIRDQTPNQYMIVIRFKRHHDAVAFFEDYNGANFNSFEANRCLLLFVDKIETAETNADTRHLHELPTCAVCLERMDDGVLAVLCNHQFHAQCLEQWQDTTCPVCRYTQTPELVAEQRCTDCGQASDLWVCLICGSVGCGRYAEAHAYRHFEATNHTFALQVGGDRVWDYAGDNYVHRLIQSDNDGKVVEYQRGTGAEMESAEKGKDAKMEAIRIEYTCLLTQQLETQRAYFERKLADQSRERAHSEKANSGEIGDLESRLSHLELENASLREDLAGMERSRDAGEKKQAVMAGKFAKCLSDLKDERDMNGLLRADQEKWKRQVEELRREKEQEGKRMQGEIAELQEQVRDLMMHFEAQTKLKDELQSTGLSQQDLQDGHLEVGDSPVKDRRKRRSKK